MKTVMVRYKIRAALAPANEALLLAVFDQLRAESPPGLRYHVYKLADEASFVHFAQIDTSDGSNPLLALESFRQFQAGLRERCSELPLAVDLMPVAGYESAPET